MKKRLLLLKKRLFSGIIGLVIVLAAWGIGEFVIKGILSATSGKFI